MIIWGHPADHT